MHASKWPQNTVNSTLAGVFVNSYKTPSIPVFSAPPVCKSGLKPRNGQGFLWLFGQKPHNSRWFFKCQGFKNGRKYLVLRKVSRLQYLVFCLKFDPLARASVQQGGALTSSRVTPDSLLPFVHPLLSQVLPKAVWPHAGVSCLSPHL